MIYNNYERYNSRWVNEGKFVSILFSRGCPYKCSYCTGSTVHGKKMRLRSIENIMGEISYLNSRWDLKQLDINDDNILFNKNWFLKLRRDLFTKFPNLNLNFYNGFHVNSMDEEIIDNLVSSGITSFTLAIESGSPYVLNELMHKKVDLEHARKIVDYCQTKKNLLVKCFYILGMPGEKMEHMRQTINYAKSINSDWSLFHAATPLPGSEIFKAFTELKCINVTQLKDLRALHFLNRSFDTPDVSANVLNDLIYHANFEVNYFENSNIKNKKYAKALSLFQEIIKNKPYNVVAINMVADIYFKLGKIEEYQKNLAQIKRLIRKDIRSRRLYEDFGPFMKTC